jgi:hypothetical protein
MHKAKWHPEKFHFNLLFDDKFLKGNLHTSILVKSPFEKLL